MMATTGSGNGLLPVQHQAPKPLPEPIMTIYQLDTQEQNLTSKVKVNHLPKQ